MHIAIEGLDGAGKTSAAKGLAEELGYVFQECPIYELVSRQGVTHFLGNLKQIDGNLHTDIAAMFFGVGNLYLRQIGQEKNVVTDRHLCATYLWNINKDNMPVFDFLAKACGKPGLTIILYAEAWARKKRIMERNPHDSDLDENIFTDEKYEKALEFVKRYNMKYIWLDNTYLNIQQTVEEIKKACCELLPLTL